MAKIDLIVDIGSSYINIYKYGEGVVLSEPSLAILSNSGEVLALGNRAKTMQKEIPPKCIVRCPIQEGAIKSYKLATAMLREYIWRVVNIKDFFFKPKIRVFVNIPCGSSKGEKRTIEKMFYECDVNEVFLVEAPIMASYGATPIVPISKYVIDIGGGITNIGFIENGELLFGKSYGIGGANMDAGIVERVKNVYELEIGLTTAELLKLEIGSLYKNENNFQKVLGRHELSLNDREVEIETERIRSVLEFFYVKIAEIVLESLKLFSDGLLERIREEGILVVGGASKIHGLKEFFEERLGIPVNIPESPSLACVYGGAKLLNDVQEFHKILNIGRDV